IRDFHVTGVQTCALPISAAHKGETVAMVVRRDGEEVALSIPLSDEGKIGIKMSPGEATRETYPVGEAAKAAVMFPIKFSAFQLEIGRASCRARASGAAVS